MAAPWVINRRFVSRKKSLWFFRSLFGKYLTLQQPESVRCVVSCSQRLTLNQIYIFHKSMITVPVAHAPCFSSASYMNSSSREFTTSSARCQHETVQRECWKCGNTLHDCNENFFCRCGFIMPPRQEADYFQLFGLDRKFSLDEGCLSHQFRELQRRLHPDKFSQKSDIERQYSAEQSSLVNKAYKTLITPLSRGLYMLELCGHPIDEQTENTNLNPEFLMEIMEINEALAETDSIDKVKDIGLRNEKVLQGLITDLSMAFEKEDIVSAKHILMHLKYYDNIDSKVKELERNQYGG